MDSYHSQIAIRIDQKCLIRERKEEQDLELFLLSDYLSLLFLNTSSQKDYSFFQNQQ